MHVGQIPSFQTILVISFSPSPPTPVSDAVAPPCRRYIGPCKLLCPSPLRPGRHSAVRRQCYYYCSRCTCACKESKAAVPIPCSTYSVLRTCWLQHPICSSLRMVETGPEHQLPWSRNSSISCCSVLHNQLALLALLLYVQLLQVTCRSSAHLSRIV